MLVSCLSFLFLTILDLLFVKGISRKEKTYKDLMDSVQGCKTYEELSKAVYLDTEKEAKKQKK